VEDTDTTANDTVVAVPVKKKWMGKKI
jgi:hypothetical protein